MITNDAIKLISQATSLQTNYHQSRYKNMNKDARMKRMLQFLALILLTSHVSAQSQADSYLPNITLFAEINDPAREAEAWAMCSTVYEFYSEIMSEGETAATSELLHQQGNGAKFAILMLQMLNLPEDATPEQFKAAYKYGQHMMETLPSQKQLQIKSDLELAKVQKTPITQVTERIKNTFQTCQNNLELQQLYIDAFRELAKSGMVN